MLTKFDNYNVYVKCVLRIGSYTFLPIDFTFMIINIITKKSQFEQRHYYM